MKTEAMLPKSLQSAVNLPQTVTVAGQTFELSDTGISQVIYTKKGMHRIPLTNFNARIVTVRVIANGTTEEHELDLELTLDGRARTLTLSAAELYQRDWIVRRFGVGAVISASRDSSELVRAAIQATAGQAIHELTITHSGWLKVDGENVFAHAGGLIRADPNRNHTASSPVRHGCNSPHRQGDGPVVPKVPIPGQTQSGLTKISVQLPSQFDDYRLPDPPRGHRRNGSLHCVLSLLELGPDRIMYPAIAAIVWCIIDRPRWSLFLYGLTGTFKTTLALLLGSFFAPGLTEERLIAWNSTANAINATLASAKNVPVIVDEFVPSPSQYGVEAANRKADDVLRAAANGSARRRCNGSGAVREEKVPQGLVIATGERAPAGESLNARLLAIELERGDLGLPELENPFLAQAQSDAKNGRFAEFTAAFIEWLAPQYERVRRELHEEADGHRAVFREDGLHARQTDLAADLLAAFDVLLTFLWESKVIGEQTLDRHWERFHEAIREQLKRHRRDAFSEDPLQRYLQFLRLVLHLGRAHLRLLDTDESTADTVISPVVLGHTAREIRVDVPVDDPAGDADECSTETITVYSPRGKQIGWKEYDGIYVNPEASIAAVEAFAREHGVVGVALPLKSLGKRLREAGLLITSSKDRNTLKRRIEGVSVEVYHFSARRLFDVQDRYDDWVVAESAEREEAELEALRDEQARQRARELKDRIWLRDMVRLLGLEPDE